MMTDGWKIIVADGSQTLPQICQAYNLNLESVINSNSQLINYYDLSEDQRADLRDFPTTREYLRSATRYNSPIASGLEIRLPEQSKGGLGDIGQTSLYYDDRSSEILAVSSRNVWTDEDLSKLPKLLTSSSIGQQPTSAYTPTDDDLSYYAYKSRNLRNTTSEFPVTSPIPKINVDQNSWYRRNHSKFNCKYWIITRRGSDRRGWTYLTREGILPTFPNEVSTSISARFTPQPIFGRSVDYQIYTGSQRTLSITMTLHAELFVDESAAITSYDEKTDEFYNPNEGRYLAVNRQLKILVADIESACYPHYDAEGEVIPPEFALQLGDQFYIKGILESVSANWSAPVIDNGLVNCELSLSITETNGPYSSDEIRKMQGFHGSRDSYNDDPYALTYTM